ncbi:hypothetical protein FUSNEC_GEN_11281_08960 [Fusobacterium necrophorum subsp. funduliforme]|uniref:hypothetical protein n=1 Tax=Fusobacterium necrophorum TaxID=859 RepID=UPI00254F9162|nr:hypothetical protein [Fusobacterium necrophorum]MDK4484745.1 hypothetical protein [Fusobacterium necrophorum]
MLHEEIKVVSEENVNEYLKEGWEYYGAVKSEGQVQFIVKRMVGKEEKISLWKKGKYFLFDIVLIAGSVFFITSMIMILYKNLGK